MPGVLPNAPTKLWPPKMLPDVAKCPMGGKIIPYWEPPLSLNSWYLMVIVQVIPAHPEDQTGVSSTQTTWTEDRVIGWHSNPKRKSECCYQKKGDRCGADNNTQTGADIPGSIPKPPFYFPFLCVSQCLAVGLGMRNVCSVAAPIVPSIP